MYRIKWTSNQFNKRVILFDMKTFFFKPLNYISETGCSIYVLMRQTTDYYVWVQTSPNRKMAGKKLYRKILDKKKTKKKKEERYAGKENGKWTACECSEIRFFKIVPF